MEFSRREREQFEATLLKRTAPAWSKIFEHHSILRDNDSGMP
jgi:hypothetical protein